MLSIKSLLFAILSVFAVADQVVFNDCQLAKPYGIIKSLDITPKPAPGVTIQVTAVVDLIKDISVTTWDLEIDFIGIPVETADGNLCVSVGDFTANCPANAGTTLIIKGEHLVPFETPIGDYTIIFTTITNKVTSLCASFNFSLTM